MKDILGFVVWLVLRVFVWAARKPSFTFRNKHDGGSPYLRRWPIKTVDAWPDAQGRTGGQGWYLHEFLSSDYERELHCHPSSCGVAFILRGGYLEQRIQRDERKPEERLHAYFPGDMNVLTGETFHRVELFGKRSWSLFYMGPRSEKGWGFLQDDGTVRRAPHNDGNTGDTAERDWTQ